MSYDNWDKNRLKRIEQKLDAAMDAMWDNAICQIAGYDDNRMKRVEQKIDQILDWERKQALDRFNENFNGK